MVEVVAAMIIRGPRCFFQQRAPHREYPLTWECPGGKVEPTDASHGHALARELTEELGPGPYEVHFDPFFIAAFGSRLRVRFHRVEVPEGWEPKLADAIAARWSTFEEMLTLDLTPGNAMMAEYLDACLPKPLSFATIPWKG